LLAQAKQRAHREGTTLTALIAEGLRDRLSRVEPRARRVIYPRVSKATGGLRPGLDWDGIKVSALLDKLDDDLPLVKRR
jgi:hypothetical protein